MAHRRGDDRGKVAWIQSSDVGRRCRRLWQSSCSSRPPSSPTRPAFCQTCHEMGPYYDAWAVGQHAETATCIDCHVDDGLPARFAHKFVALGEVKAHFLGDTTFPAASACRGPQQPLHPLSRDASADHRGRLLAQGPRREGHLRGLPFQDRPRCDDCRRCSPAASSTRASRGSRKPVSSPPSTAVRPTSRDIRRSPARAAMTWPRPAAHGAIGLSPGRSILGRATARSATSRAPSSHSSTRPRPTAPRVTRSMTSTSGPRRAHSGRARRVIRLRAARGSSSTVARVQTARAATSRRRSTTPASARTVITSLGRAGSSRIPPPANTHGRVFHARPATPRATHRRTARATAATLRATEPLGQAGLPHCCQPERTLTPLS